MCNGPSVVISFSVYALVSLFQHTLKWLSSSLFSKAQTISGKNNSNFICYQRKPFGKMQQNIKSNIKKLIAIKSYTKSPQYSWCVFYKTHLVLTTKWNFSTETQHLFLAFILQFKIYCATYCALCCAVVKQEIMTTQIIFSFQNNFCLINDAPLFKLVAFNVALVDVALFKRALFDAALLDVELL